MAHPEDMEHKYNVHMLHIHITSCYIFAKTPEPNQWSLRDSHAELVHKVEEGQNNRMWNQNPYPAVPAMEDSIQKITSLSSNAQLLHQIQAPVQTIL